MSAPLQVVEDRPSVQIPANGAAPKYPVQSANVLTHLHENIATEYAAVIARQIAVRDELDALLEYQETLEAVARAARIALL